LVLDNANPFPHDAHFSMSARRLAGAFSALQHALKSRHEPRA
jgi:hypothetical protein